MTQVFSRSTVVFSLALAALVTMPLPIGQAAAFAAQPSFDCDGARGEIERLICTDDELAALDVRFAKDFASAMARSPANRIADLRARARNWMKDRNACAKASDPRSCTADVYKRMLEGL
jgi:Uncharacterized protein conserved in bacteria, putative lipoprotein